MNCDEAVRFIVGIPPISEHDAYSQLHGRESSDTRPDEPASARLCLCQGFQGLITPESRKSLQCRNKSILFESLHLGKHLGKQAQASLEPPDKISPLACWGTFVIVQTLQS